MTPSADSSSSSSSNNNNNDDTSGIPIQSGHHNKHTTTTKYKHLMKSYNRNDLEVYELLETPIWVFDIERKSMWWANTAALQLWDAHNLDTLLERDFTDMSDATISRLNDYMRKFRNGEKVLEKWTYYPQGKATTVNVAMSGIYIIDDNLDAIPRLAMLNNGQAQVINDQSEEEALRGVEMLRHIPVAVEQFDINGTIMAQNPEAMNLFGNNIKDYNDDHNSSSSDREGIDDIDDHSTTTAKHHKNNPFHKRFLDRELGKRILKEVVEQGKEFSIEAQQNTLTLGPKWFKIQVRQSRDPVSAKPVVLYSAIDITQAVQAKEEAVEADEANSAKSDFFAMMAHEIRTPLHQVNGFVELLGQTSLSRQQLEYIYQIESSSNSMMCIINDLLDLTKLEAGKMELESIPFDTKDVVQGTLAAVFPKVTAKGLELRSNLSSSTTVDKVPDQVIGDPNRLRQLLMNLLSNAIKFTHSGEIALNISVCDEPLKTEDMEVDGNMTKVLEFSVADTGIGILKEHQQYIFHKYQQANASVAREFGGTGLGLNICKSLVEAMGGMIGLESEAGVGSKFWFRIPYELPAPFVNCCSSSAESPSSSCKVSHTVSIEKESCRCLEDSFRLTENEEGGKLNILIVEDNKVNQKLAKAMVSRLGHHSSIAENGQVALDMIKINQYDLILMDIQMPVLDGMETTKQIREDMHLSAEDLPIIGITASYQPAENDKYITVGMNRCIGKPVRFNLLETTIQEVLG